MPFAHPSPELALVLRALLLIVMVEVLTRLYRAGLLDPQRLVRWATAALVAWLYRKDL